MMEQVCPGPTLAPEQIDLLGGDTQAETRMVSRKQRTKVWRKNGPGRGHNGRKALSGERVWLCQGRKEVAGA